MVGNFFLLEQFPDTLQLADFFSAVKEDTVGMNFEMHKATFVEVPSEAVFISAIGLLHVQDQLIEVVRSSWTLRNSICQAPTLGASSSKCSNSLKSTRVPLILSRFMDLTSERRGVLPNRGGKKRPQKGHGS